MFFEISHKTTYTYSRPVFLELHHLRIRPRCDGVQNVTYFESTVEPCPAGSTDGIDIDGNIVDNVWFQGLTEKLIVASRAKIITQYRNPFNYILAERADRLPISCQDPLQAFLAPYTVRRNESHLIEQFARHIANRTEWKTLRFLTMLTQGNFRKLSTNRPGRWRDAQRRRNLFEPSRIEPRSSGFIHRRLPLCRHRGAFRQWLLP